ncbi:major facilitator-type transporter ecdD [Physcia stellaris]|nr:major facilitator-type transporter ecdD [Physcia stellaris]
MRILAKYRTSKARKIEYFDNENRLLGPCIHPWPVFRWCSFVAWWCSGVRAWWFFSRWCSSDRVCCRQALAVDIPPRDPDIVYLSDSRSPASSSHSSRSSDLVLLPSAPAPSRRDGLRPLVPAPNPRFWDSG